ncbi:MAG: LysM peptidoglycan-binding domain-containing protein [Caldilineales bacterium]
MCKSRVTVFIVIAFVLAAFALPDSGIAASLKQGSVTYVVQRGDNLSSIASRYGSSVSAIVQANGLTTTVIRPGQSLIVPIVSGTGSGAPETRVTSGSPATSASSGGSHVVRRGESLWSIASRYGVSISALRSLNGLSGDVILPGQTLSIPASSGRESTIQPGSIPPPQVAPSASGCSGSYTVKPGDTLYGIAARCGVSVRRLQEANGITGSSIYRGLTLVIPTGSSSVSGNPASPPRAIPSQVPSYSAPASAPQQGPASQPTVVIPFPTPVPPFPPLSYPTPGP